jgi:hypothetical protein
MTDINLDRDNDERIDEILKLTKDNNRMLHSMRRGAFISGFLKFVIYAAIIAATIWVYITFAMPLLSTLLKQVASLQSMNSQAQEQISGVQSGAADNIKSVTDTLNTIESQLKVLSGSN